jgi:hypothetical protein
MAARGYLISILVAFAVFMTFIALSIAGLLFYFSFARGSILDVVIPICLALVTTALSLIIFRRVKNTG